MLQRPPPIRTDGSNAFASHTMRVRVPAILAAAIDAQPRATPWVADALRALRDEVTAAAPLRLVAGPAPDCDAWDAFVAPHRSETWLSTEWFFAETYLYRRVVEAARWFETEVDPFRATKDEELARAATWDVVHAAQSLAAMPAGDERALALLDAALWGNRMDLSYAAAAAHGTSAHASDLLADDRARALPLLVRPGTRIALVADNAGTELLVDLVLAGALVAGGAASVVLHVKVHPTFVSDAIAADVRDGIRRLGPALEAAFADGRLRIAPDFFWNSPQFVDAAPPRIVRALADADLAIVKGDANYRRLVGDAEWDPTTKPEAASGPLPCPMLALRTLKSDPIVGLPPGLAPRLDAESPTWRVDGRRGVAQWFDGGRAIVSS